MQRLKISFDGLDRAEKQIFIGITSFFNKKEQLHLKSDAITIWKASGWSAEHAVQYLQESAYLNWSWGNSNTTYALKCKINSAILEDKWQTWALLGFGDQKFLDLWCPCSIVFSTALKCTIWKGKWQMTWALSCGDQTFVDLWKQTDLNKSWQKQRAGVSIRSRIRPSRVQTIITYFIGSSNDSAETDLLCLDIDNRGYLGCELENIPSWIPLRKLHNLSVNSVGNLWGTFQKRLQINTQASFELRVLKICYSPSLEKLPDLIAMFNSCDHLNNLAILDHCDCGLGRVSSSVGIWILAKVQIQLIWILLKQPDE
ncbi:uncharacterized protein LOC131037378 [Cryptomeria japonica]|uniref:uncharacterized protein LOC131037378 n=1 Tax=Cryptomeria japonica TaxID=3369 RepID=UPI0027DA3E69|nr:uncharacterized protein LOC131037378 [Cryptomeria japonica]XP_057825489.2 uncharacterized protein LOC131037378 [Cryptomeria japonica]XP_059074134.1 uncharacterized protein LOC131037378 [Cryptomeria japonica]